MGRTRLREGRPRDLRLRDLPALECRDDGVLAVGSHPQNTRQLNARVRYLRYECHVRPAVRVDGKELVARILTVGDHEKAGTLVPAEPVIRAESARHRAAAAKSVP